MVAGARRCSGGGFPRVPSFAGRSRAHAETSRADVSARDHRAALHAASDPDPACPGGRHYQVGTRRRPRPPHAPHPHHLLVHLTDPERNETPVSAHRKVMKPGFHITEARTAGAEAADGTPE